MDIHLEQNDTKGRYHTTVDGHVAEMTFSRAGPSRIIIDHTGVPEQISGQGIGGKLVARAVEDARKNGWTIVPLCPFAAHEFREHSDWKDVLDR